MNLDDDLHEEDDNFVVDEQGNAVRYDNDEEEEEYEDTKNIPKIIKLFGNMQQGKKEVKSTKVPKSLLNQKKGVMSDLMKQVDEDDESSLDNKNNQMSKIDSKFKDNNIDYGMLDDYVPNYTQSQREKKEEKSEGIIIEQLEENIDIEADDKPIKLRTIKREKKVLADDSTGNIIKNRSAFGH